MIALSRRRKGIVKIGEGCFGEVFRTVASTNSSTGDETVEQIVAIKLVPIEGKVLFNGDSQKSFNEVLSEVIVSKELTALSIGLCNRTESFVQLKSVNLVQGSFPTYLTKAWEKYHREKESENDHPRIFPKDQLWLVIESVFGGSALENNVPTCPAARLSVLRQVAFALAVAEAELKFEHRDLHWGNVLIHRTTSKTSISQDCVSCSSLHGDDGGRGEKVELPSIHFRLQNRHYQVPSFGCSVVIIDFTLSRLEQNGGLVYVNLSADPALFESKGDYQFDIYRLMRSHNRDRWDLFSPKTNLLWLHYLATKLHFSPSGLPTDSSDSVSAFHLGYTRQLVSLECDLRLSDYVSASDLVQRHPVFTECLRKSRDAVR
ncbi:serine/threonine-protein kinase haspin [Paragonimus westermani]|uniref:non-specific serine/threonine protein kinase n=1 Tax=Paragonimus westermani TaxID=34504 RepID=A0A5J4NES4_9TREM|nr:serine/threonine-protein kinase haspin [Paragonimus westermani]